MTDVAVRVGFFVDVPEEHQTDDNSILDYVEKIVSEIQDEYNATEQAEKHGLLYLDFDKDDIFTR